MLKKINWKSVGKNIGILAIYIVMSITVMGLSGEIFRDFDFDEGLLTGFRQAWKELTTDDGYASFTIIICIAYCYERLTRKVMNIFKRKEKKSDS